MNNQSLQYNIHHYGFRQQVDGGRVLPYPTSIHNDYFKDTIPTTLEIGELVVSKKYVPLVEKFLKSNGIHLPGM